MRLMGFAVATATFGLALAPAAVNAAATSVEALPVATITVSGHGEITRPPDTAAVTVTIVTSDDSAARALSENNRRFSALGTKLGGDGIAPSDIVSTSISSYFNPRPPAAAPATSGQLYGYVVSRNVQINVNTLAATGSVVDAATASGATQINGVSYGFHDRRAIERAALAAAINDAQAQAQTIAAAAHVQIVRILRIGDESGPPGRVAPLAMTMMRAAPENVPTTIAPSDLDVTSTISVTFVIR